MLKVRKLLDRFNKTCIRHYSTQYAEGDTVYGWRLKKIEKVSEFNITSYLLKNEKHGTELIHVDASHDTNNACVVTFPTVPKDSTGVAHILEHTTLCGSQKYPVRDLFFNMYSRSLNTYMNAWTAPDHTSYPFATQNQTDFYNLMSVYLDATFFPLLSKNHFRQEGHRLEYKKTDDVTSELQFKGVVYNEMKGAMGDPSTYFSSYLARYLLPGTTYENNSGGEPSEIPNLTHEQLKAFHDRFYHPSIAKFFTYGNLPFEQHIKFINQHVLDKFPFDKIKPVSPQELERDLGNVQLWEAPKKVHIVGPPESVVQDAEKQIKVSVAYLTNPRTDSMETFKMMFISSLVLDEPRGPFYKNLIASGLAPDFAPGTGYENSMAQTCFAIGVQGIDKATVEKVEQVIEQTWREVAEHGIEQSLIDSAFHALELSVKTKSPHFGIGLSRAVGIEWLYGNKENPLSALHANKRIEQLRQDLKDPSFFSSRIKKYFLDNTHRLSLVMSPDASFVEQQNEVEKIKLQNIHEKLSSTQKNQIVQEGLELKRDQEKEPNKNILPTLTIADIPRKTPDPINLTTLPTSSKHKLFYNEASTNGIVHLSTLTKVPLQNIPEKLRNLIPLFAALVSRLGARDMDHRKLAEQIELHTGGISASPIIVPSLQGKDTFELGIQFSTLCLERNIDRMADLVHAIYKQARFTNADMSFLQAQLEQMAMAASNGILDSGHSFAQLLASAQITSYDAVHESFDGLTSIKQLNELAASSNPEELASQLAELATYLLNNENLQVMITSESSQMDKTAKALENTLLSEKISVQTQQETSSKIPHTLSTSKLFIPIPAPVNFCSTVFKTAPFVSKDACVLRVASNLMNSQFLHKEIREKGGAYGSMASQSMGGTFSFASYRDPNVARTLDVYFKVMDWMQSTHAFGDKELEEAKLQTFQGLDSPTTPHQRAQTLFVYGITEPMRQERRNYFLDATRMDILEVCDKYLNPQRNKLCASAVLGDKSAAPKDKDWIIQESTN